MKRPSGSVLLVLGLLVLFITAAIISLPLFEVSGTFHPHPSDGDLLKRFREHRADVEELVRMFKADEGLGRVGPNFTRPEVRDA